MTVEPRPAHPTCNVRLLRTYATIQEAIDDAADGDVISVRAGSYRESLRCHRSVTIEAIGAAQFAPPANWNALVVYGDHEVALEGFAVYLEGTSTLVVSDRATISITNCVVRGSGEAALGDLGLDAQLRISGSTISGLSPLAIGASSSATVASSLVGA